MLLKRVVGIFTDTRHKFCCYLDGLGVPQIYRLNMKNPSTEYDWTFDDSVALNFVRSRTEKKSLMRGAYTVQRIMNK